MESVREENNSQNISFELHNNHTSFESNEAKKDQKEFFVNNIIIDSPRYQNKNFHLEQSETTWRGSVKEFEASVKDSTMSLKIRKIELDNNLIHDKSLV